MMIKSRLITLEVSHLIYVIHNSLSPEDSETWPARVAEALTPGADTTLAWARFVVWLLTEECPSESGAAVAALYLRQIDGDQPSEVDWAVGSAEVAARKMTEGRTVASGTAWAAASLAIRARADAFKAAAAAQGAALAVVASTSASDANAVALECFGRMAAQLERILSECIISCP